MQVDVEVFGTKRGKHPEDDGRGKGSFDLTYGATIEQAFQQLNIPTEMRYIIMVNGKQQTERSTPLSEGDQLTVLPPVTGG